MRFFGLKSCDTCRKALGQIRAAGIAPQVIDVRADGIAPTDLATILSQFGDAAINRASTTWRGLTEDQRAIDPAILLADHPTLLKRPVIENAGRWTIGWTPGTQANILKS
jgi:arsenate reductase-like glutaredoxin family protein